MVDRLLVLWLGGLGACQEAEVGVDALEPNLHGFAAVPPMARLQKNDFSVGQEVLTLLLVLDPGLQVRLQLFGHQLGLEAVLVVLDDRQVPTPWHIFRQVMHLDGLAVRSDDQGVRRKAQVLFQAVDEGQAAVALRGGVAQGPVVRRLAKVQAQVVGFLAFAAKPNLDGVCE